MKKREVVRIVMRQEGAWWNAYYAMNDQMNLAIPLGAIAARLVCDNPARKEAFKNLMIEALSDVIEDVAGERPGTRAGAAPAEQQRSQSS